MEYSEQLENKIKTYLGSLSPKAVEALVRNLERAKAQRNAEPHLTMILAAALELLRGPSFDAPDMPGGAQRRGQIQRMFFAPLDEFLINEFLPSRQEGRIHRGYLDKVWKWLGRDVMASDVRMVLEQAGNAAVSGERIDSLVQALRTRSVDAIGEALRRGDTSEKEHRRMGIELGGGRGIAEVRDIQKIFGAERWLVPLLNTIPDRINEHRLKRDHDVLRLVDKCSVRFPDHVPVLASALVERAEAPAALCTFAGRLTGDSDPKTIANSQFSPFVDVVMSEAERLQILALEHRQHNPDPVAFSQALSEYHALVRGVERDMDLSVTGKWQQQLSGTKRTISDVVTRELNSAHGAIRRALQVPKLKADGTPDIDQTAINDAVRALRVVTMARNASETLAVNDVSKRTRQAVEQTLEILTRSLIADLEKARGPQVDQQQAAADAAILLSEIYFGEDYAAQLRRSRQSAATKAKNSGVIPSNPERKLVSSVLKRA
ncbi:hypothetical protein E1180_09445 [Roseibium denhamense]|uniref:DUF3375 domain-containing protein n=1 Tax=Roseibium denhamense TaxID=76305 RepID=A0ABY1PN78_9HYPH|nr:hypothetical protein [Roseibium denhamense]MTI05739.1 hypothetical protein [Roseibium denhamense]SMP36971.1 hypothetical protein SAMN06265374_4408 [Roseibium denhamense]